MKKSISKCLRHSCVSQKSVLFSEIGVPALHVCVTCAEYVMKCISYRELWPKQVSKLWLLLRSPARLLLGGRLEGRGRLGRVPAPSLSPSQSLHFDLLSTLGFRLWYSLNKGCSDQKAEINDSPGSFLGILGLRAVVTGTRPSIVSDFLYERQLGTHPALMV